MEIKLKKNGAYEFIAKLGLKSQFLGTRLILRVRNDEGGHQWRPVASRYLQIQAASGRKPAERHHGFKGYRPVV